MIPPRLIKFFSFSKVVLMTYSIILLEKFPFEFTISRIIARVMSTMSGFPRKSHDVFTTDRFFHLIGLHKYLTALEQ